MSNEQRLEELMGIHAALEQRLIEARANHAPDIEISDIKKKKLQAKDMIEKLKLESARVHAG